MASVHRTFIIGGVIVCVLSTQVTATLFASEAIGPSSDELVTETTAAADTIESSLLEAPRRQPLTFDGAPVTTMPMFDVAGASPTFTPSSSAFMAASGQVYQGRPYRIERDRSIAALMIGAVATITGTALLVYANRPDCSTNPVPGGCGYGMKVVGTSVLTGGVVSLFIGALTWR